MRNLFLIICSAAFLHAGGQSKKEFVFDPGFESNTSYITEVVSTSISKIDFSGPDEKIDRIKASGTTLPMVVEASTRVQSTRRTFDLQDDGSFRSSIVYGNVESVQVQNGERTEKENPISGMVVEGSFNANNQFKIDTLISDKLDENTRTTLKYGLEDIDDQIVFPDYPLKVGDAFDQEVPVNIPMAGLGEVGIVVKTNYLLKEIRDNLATFDIVQTVELNMDIYQTNATATGNGTGIAYYDISRKFITKYASDLTMKMEMVFDDLTTIAEVESKTLHEVVIGEVVNVRSKNN